MQTLANYLRGLDPQLPRTVWLIQVGGLVNALGNGIVFPFAVIYLHNVRGISFAQAGFALAIGGAAALTSGWLAGSLVDRIGGGENPPVGPLGPGGGGFPLSPPPPPGAPGPPLPPPRRRA